MKLTAKMLEACYGAVRQSIPGWRLPPPEHVRFTVTDHRGQHADWTFDGQHAIRVSRNTHNLAITVLRSVAHECCHIRVHMVCPSERSEHGPEWVKAARTLCKVWGWDVADF